MAKKSEQLTFEDKVDLMVTYLERMDKRDRLRTWGGFFRSLIGLIPILFFIWSIWYIANHGEALLDMITQKAAQQAAAVTTNTTGDFIKQFEGLLP